MSKKIYIILLISLIGFLSCCEIKAWSCLGQGNSRDGVCKNLSNNYTEPYCSEGTNTDATRCTWSTLSNMFSPDRKQTDTSVVIEKYCKAMLSTSQELGRVYFAKASPYNNGTWDWEQTFDSRQSIFVYALCASFSREDGTTFVEDKELSENITKIFKGEGNIAKILKLQQWDQNGKDACSLSKKNSLDECDMSIYATEIFSTMMSDIFKIKYAQVFSVDSVENFPNTEDRMNAFFSGYFLMPDYKTIKNQYPQTIRVVNSNQEYYKKVLSKKLKLLNNSELVEITPQDLCAVGGNVTGENFIKCAMHGSQGRGLTLDPPFITLLYNEILSYQLFEKAYQSRLSSKLSEKGISEKERIKYESKIWDFQSYANKQIDAVYNTLHDLEELNMTYPLHIGLLMYQEKLKKFRDKKLSPVITLFYSLSEKLQNVQLPY